MAAMMEYWSHTETHEVIPGNAAEGTGVRCEWTGDGVDLVSGLYTGLSVRCTTAAVGDVTFRVYDSVSTSPGATGILLHEFDVPFSAQDEPSLDEVQPKPFFSGLVVTAEAAGAGRKADVTPFVKPLAGRR